MDCWIHAGRGLGRNPPYICVSADSHGAGILLKAVHELALEDAPATLKLTLRSERRDSFQSFRLRLLPASNELRKLAVTVDNQTPTLEFTTSGLGDLTSALESWMEGHEDFSLHPRGRKSEMGAKDMNSGELWFWVTMLP